MNMNIYTPSIAIEHEITDFLQSSQGWWYSRRRYHYLTGDGSTQDISSNLSITYLEGGTDELHTLSRMFLDSDAAPEFICGAILTWDSVDSECMPVSSGRIVMGATAEQLYRDHGYATRSSVISDYTVCGPQLVLSSSYGGNSYLETIRLLDAEHRTRQTEAYRNGNLTMVGQYMEQRVSRQVT